MASKVTRFDATWRFPVGLSKRACLHEQNHAHFSGYGRTSGARSRCLHQRFWHPPSGTCNVVFSCVLRVREGISNTSCENRISYRNDIQMYCTFVLLLNQHFPGLPSIFDMCSFSQFTICSFIVISSNIAKFTDLVRVEPMESETLILSSTKTRHWTQDPGISQTHSQSSSDPSCYRSYLRTHPRRFRNQNSVWICYRTILCAHASLCVLYGRARRVAVLWESLYITLNSFKHFSDWWPPWWILGLYLLLKPSHANHNIYSSCACQLTK
jgi:hypothetical protein